MLLILIHCLAILSTISCSDDRLWFPRALMPQKSSESFSRSGNRHVGLRTSHWTQYQPDLSEQKLQVAKRTYEPAHISYMMSPLNDQVLEANEQLGSNYIQLMRPTHGGCNAQPTTVQLSKQELDPLTGQPGRTCRGLVQVNRCDGFCGSSVRPTVKSPVGLKKDCYCCNEGSFKQVQVRLSECYSAVDQRLISHEDEPTRSYMDVLVEEPSECKCRRCDGFL